jgi:ribulose-phosphate 3-epimerase
MVVIAPSILASDLLHLADEAKAVEAAGANRLHLDVMDGSFVPNISFGIPVVKALRGATKLPIECHLMIVHPENYLDAFAEAGADTIIIHQEVSPHLDRSINHIKSLGKKAGVCLNPSTPVSLLEDTIELFDLILIMTVNPGFGGQPFIPYSYSRIAQTRALLDARNPACDLEVDGGIDEKTAPKVAAAGANVLVAGTAVFRHSQGPAAGVRGLLKAATEIKV